MIRFNSAGRVQAIEGMYLAHPGTCLLCGKVPTHPQEYFASLGVELEYYGLAYLCQACCHEIADFVMYVDPSTTNHLLETNDILIRKNIEMQKSLAAAKEMLSARIDAAGRSEFSLNEPDDVPLPEVESDASFIDSVLDGDKSKSA